MKPLNKTAVIIGVGQIGGSIGLALKESNFFSKIYGYDKNIPRLKLAEKFLDNIFDNVEMAIKNSDVIILAQPISEILKTLTFGFEDFPTKLYTDVGSTKSPMLELSTKFQNIRYVGGHPLAGSEKIGESGWDALLFKGKPYFFIFDENQTENDRNLVFEMIKAIGAKPISVSVTEHDWAIAMTSHLPLLLSLSMMSLLSDREKQLIPFIGSGFKSLTRLAGGSPQMGKDLLISNRENIVEELEQFLAKLSELKNIMINKDDILLMQKMKSYQELYWRTVEKSE